MKVAIDIDNKVIITSVPNMVTESSEFIKNNGYMLVDLPDVIESEVKDKDGIPVPIYRALTDVELYPLQVKKWKEQRQELVDSIEVTYNGIVYQGDEISQSRMTRAMNGMDDGDTIKWKAKDNSTVVLTKTDLKEILRVAGQEQTRIWFRN